MKAVINKRQTTMEQLFKVGDRVQLSEGIVALTLDELKITLSTERTYRVAEVIEENNEGGLYRLSGVGPHILGRDMRQARA